MEKKVVVVKTVLTIAKCELLALVSAVVMAIHYCYESIGWYEDWLRLLWQDSNYNAVDKLDMYKSWKVFAEEFAMARPAFIVVVVLAAIVGLYVSYQRYFKKASN